MSKLGEIHSQSSRAPSYQEVSYPDSSRYEEPQVQNTERKRLRGRDEARWVELMSSEMKGLWTPAKESKSMRTMPWVSLQSGEGSVLIGLISLKISPWLWAVKRWELKKFTQSHKPGISEQDLHVNLQGCNPHLIPLHPCWVAAHVEPSSEKLFRNPPFEGALRMACSHLVYPPHFPCFAAGILHLLVCFFVPLCE